jgi:hypothetical protein
VKRGVVYACSHPHWLGETIRSAQSCRRHMPDVACQLFVTEALVKAAGEGLRQHFTDMTVLSDSSHVHRPRFESALETDLDQAIFIDGDTLFLAPVYELFDLLDHFDIAAALAPQYFASKAIAKGIYDLLPKISSAQPEWNTGVIVARVDDPFKEMVREWSALFSACRNADYTMDQASFRSALSTSRLRIAALPNNYNFRANIANSVTGAVKILHAHGDLEKIGANINAALHIRVYTPQRDSIHGFFPKPTRPA